MVRREPDLVTTEMLKKNPLPSILESTPGPQSTTTQKTGPN